MPERAKLDFSYEDEWGFVVTGNDLGLGYLANLISELRDAPCRLDHVHLSNDDAPLGSRSYPVTVYKEDDQWFDRLETTDDEAVDDEVVRRDLDPTQIFALQFLQLPPPEVPLSVHRLYRVHDVVEAPAEPGGDLLLKPYEGGPGRRFLFRLVADSQRGIGLVVHLDDPGVNFFTKRDLLRVVLQTA